VPISLSSVARRGGVSRDALGTPTPERDLGLVDDEAPVVGDLDARRRASEALDVDDDAAVPADQMMVVVAGPGFKERRAPGGLDPPRQSHTDERTQCVIHGLGRYRPQALSDKARQLLSAVMVPPRAQDLQNGNALRGTPQPSRPNVGPARAHARDTILDYLKEQTSPNLGGPSRAHRESHAQRGFSASRALWRLSAVATA
jgi:hypothetical protein